MATLAAAVLAVQLARQRPRVAAMCALLWTGSAVATLPAVLQQTAAHDEDALISKATESLAGHVQADAPAAWLAVRSYADGDTQGLHLHWPTWRFGQRTTGLRLVPVDAVLAAWQQRTWPREPVYLLRSLRCYAHPIGKPRPLEWRGCRDLAGLAGAAPLWQMDLVNRSDSPTFAWYGTAPTLRVGLYRLQPPP
jgi:hypothetical protein